MSQLRITTRMIRLTTMLVVTAGLAAGLAACGGDSKSASASDNNQADVAFVQHMLPHHMHGVEMATLAEQKGTTSQVRDLGRRIATQQKKEISQMQGFLKDWKAKAGPAAPPVKMTADGKQIAMLKADSGKAFDRDFLMFMMDHHLSAIDMAQIEQTSGQKSGAKSLASSIVSKQEMEAKEMQQLLAGI